MSEPSREAGAVPLDSWYIGAEGDAAHCLFVDWIDYARAYCGADGRRIVRPALPSDQRCRACEVAAPAAGEERNDG